MTMDAHSLVRREIAAAIAKVPPRANGEAADAYHARLVVWAVGGC